MKNLKINLFFGLFFLATASFAQAVKKDTVKTNQLEEVVVRGSIIDVAKERKTPVAVLLSKRQKYKLKQGIKNFQTY